MKLRLFRGILVLHVLGVLTQSVLAGQFLAGADNMVLFHEINGWCIATLGVLQTGLAFTMLRQRGGLWFAIGSIFLLIGEGLQVGTGYGRYLGVHVPLALLIVTGLVAMAAAAFRNGNEPVEIRA